ncbi:hypothetical protein [Novipirellula artificiosorum]|uniref:Uncharacterized protein n=1 Tax=Novipirellula artificiosorum TaxID=2528016 RepID=A0A5C6DGF8_9BACT|nr:hypothetical protein [Novipirellula artificiosorum]TWU35890.1 hypothetical protein Poly41_36410 [Novipirellula artificiosorum]
MKRILFVFLSFLSVANLFSQDYPFQDTSLTDDARLENLVSLLTLEEKIDCLSTQPFVPRLGINHPVRIIIEGLHGVALSGPANWARTGKGASPTTTFPQAIGLAQRMPSVRGFK